MWVCAVLRMRMCMLYLLDVSKDWILASSLCLCCIGLFFNCCLGLIATDVMMALSSNL